ncbi:hypothetical protein O181_014046 [Austropuccinia psidii MF-1]|uniref:Uncharacterized protein n=1 Tax=Austropuccinia psidii MF-1 TaxID=1389203 RepID=A0A9Q3BXG6_9BASI|nr:hypothetical protein [Austropuccinia psidii MF-1]
MPVQHSHPAKNTRSQGIKLGPPIEGEAPSRSGGVKSRRSRSFSGLLGGYPSIPQGPTSRLGEAEETGVAAALAGAIAALEAPNLALSNQPHVSQAEPNFLKIMEKMTQFMGQLTQEVAPRDTSKAPAFKTPSMKAPDSFDGTEDYKLRGFIQYCQLIFHNDPANFFSDRKKLFTLSSDPNEVRKAEQALDNLRMKESGQVSLNIADFRSLMSRIEDWGERAYTHVYRRGLASRLLDQLASHPGNFDSLQELMEIALELDTIYH